ncbi:RING-H2 finger protein ATL56-like [Cornus florida]|uniref:RING-H2 finger protein ATL56-like n=1 Tax=Cornus florida TaxID=4283 RepID=UPI002896449A|nr:RING-H2 finger protein ATL56-like [Cornus florida]
MPTDDDGSKHDDHRHAIVRLNPNPPSSNAAAITTTTPSPKPNPRFLSFLLRAIIMALIVSLFLLFLGVAAFALLHIFLAGRALHRHRNRSRRHTTPDAYSADDLQRFLNRSKYVHELPGTVKDCAVCLDSFREGQWCRSLPSCNHMFHEKCVDSWLTRMSNCPICRTRVRLNSGASASVISNDDCNLLWAVGVGQRGG